MNSIQYYNDNSKKFIEGTLQANMKQHYRDFLEHLSSCCKILDLGCGSGRDSLYFYKLGYDVTSLDGSIEMVKYCKETLSNTIIHSTFDDYQSNVLFDGIWACASLLHVERDKLVAIIIKYLNMISINGIFFMSFKNRDHDFSKDGRFFTCLTYEGLSNILKKISNIEIVGFSETKDVRLNRDEEHWISVIIKRVC